MTAVLVGLGVWFLAWVLARREGRYLYRSSMSTLQRLLEGHVNEVLTEANKEGILKMGSREWPEHLKSRYQGISPWWEEGGG